MIETFVQLKPRSQWRDGVTTDSLKKELDSMVTLPGVRNAWVMPIKARIDMLATGIKTPVGVKVAGPELKTIQDIGQRLEQVLAEVPGTASVHSEHAAAGYVKAAQAMVAERVALPKGYSLHWSGQYEYMQRVKERLSYVVPLTLAIIVLLYMNFRRFAEVAIIMGSLPLALVGAIWLMHLLGYNFSVAAGVGFIALAGVAVEIGVIMLTYLNRACRQMSERCEREGGEPKPADLIEAVTQGAGLRPVMMTALSTMPGLLPLMYSSGTGSEVVNRIAAPMVGGMGSALVLTLPVLSSVCCLWKGRALGPGFKAGAQHKPKNPSRAQALGEIRRGLPGSQQSWPCPSRSMMGVSASLRYFSGSCASRSMIAI